MNRFTKIELIPVSAPPTNGGPNGILYFNGSNNQLNFLAPNLTPGATNGTLSVLSGGTSVNTGALSGNVIANAGVGPTQISSDQFSFTSGLTYGTGASGYLYGQTALAAGSGIAVTSAVNITSTIILSIGNAGNFSTLGTPYVGNKAPGKSFQIRSTNGGDTSVIHWQILN